MLFFGAALVLQFNVLILLLLFLYIHKKITDFFKQAILKNYHSLSGNKELIKLMNSIISNKIIKILLLYLTNLPIFTIGRLYLLVHAQTASEFSFAHRYKQASLRLSNKFFIVVIIFHEIPIFFVKHLFNLIMASVVKSMEGSF